MIYTTKNIAQTFQNVSANTIITPILNVSNSTKIMVVVDIKSISNLEQATVTLQLSNDSISWNNQQILGITQVGSILFDPILNNPASYLQVSYSSVGGVMTLKTTLTAWITNYS